MDMKNCRLCPRECGADRTAGIKKRGICGAGDKAAIARAKPHFWEEPCISGSKGSGAVFFSGCSLKCVYCQNHEISSKLTGKEADSGELREIFRELEKSGVHNINLVNPTHFASIIAQALEEPLSVPVVYNTGGYDKVETLRMLEGKISIYLPDIKYSDDTLGSRYSGVSDYFETAKKAVTEMYRQVGRYRLDENGIMQSGVLIRHLILPGNPENSKGVIRWVDENFSPGTVMFSLMSQYTPHVNVERFVELSRRLTRQEYEEIESFLLDTGIEDGYLQDLDSACEDYIPDFDLTPLQ